MKFKICVLIFLFPTMLLYAQKEANHWYFGEHAGLDFSSGTPVFDGNSAMASDKGCTSISDTLGNLLFYANSGDISFLQNNWAGVVCNRNHQVMLNGFLKDTCGDGSTFQSSLIVPKVGEESQYYLFTLDDLSGLKKGLRYSIIDMTLDNGLGAVVTKGVPIVDSMLTGMVATKHTNGVDFWLIVRRMPAGPWTGMVNYLAYKISATGIHLPVVTPEDAQNEYGKTCKFSPDGNLLYSGKGIYNFNKSTGTFSGFRMLRDYSYSCAAFSPNNKVLYAYYMGSSGFNIEQFDLTAPDISATGFIIDKEVHIGTCPSKGAMQLGPDSKIYVSYLFDKISVINAPNVLGIGCDFAVNVISLSGKDSWWEFPNFPSSYFYTDSIRPCPPKSLTYSITSASNGQSDGSVFVDVSGGQPPYQYSLDSINFQTSNKFAMLDTGAYSIYVVDSNKCVTKDAFSINPIAGLESSKINYEPKIFPNPFSDNLYIESNNNEKINVAIVDLNGTTILSNQYKNVAFVKLDLSYLNPGFYFLKITRDNDLYIQKLVVN